MPALKEGNKMTNENLTIDCKELLDLKKKYPLEIEVIMWMLAEAGDDYYAEMHQLEYPAHSASNSAWLLHRSVSHEYSLNSRFNSSSQSAS